MGAEEDPGQSGARRSLRLLAIGQFEGNLDEAALAALNRAFTLQLERADSVAAARASLARDDYDLALCDAEHSDGLAVLAAIRDSGKDVGLIALTGQFTGQTEVQLLRAGARAVIGAGQLAQVVPVAQRELDDAIVRRAREIWTLLDYSPDPILIAGPGGKIVHANRPLEHLLGYGIDELGGESVEMLLPEALRELHARQREEYAAQPYARPMGIGMELLARRKDGRSIPVEISLRPIVVDGLGYVCCALRDVSERRRAEASLAAGDNLLRALFDHSSVGMAVNDLAGGRRTANEALCHMLGYSAAEMATLPWEEVTPPEDRATAGDERARLERGEIDRLEGDVRYRRKDGSLLWARRALNLVRDVHRRPAQIVAVVQDVTERMRAEEIEREKAKLEAANEELSAFSYTVAHDLRAPLRAIAGFAGLLHRTEGERLSAEGQRHLERIDAAARRLHELIEGLLKYARSAQSDLAVVELDLKALASEAVEALAPSYPAAQLRIGALPAARGDRALVLDVLLNLIGNALKFSSKREQPMVEIGTATTERGAAVFVRDNGAGFDARYAAKLFGVFQRLHGESEFPGSGIGLAFAHRVLARLGGEIWAESAPDAGATFYFTLPAAG